MENGKFDVENINPNLCTHIVYTYFAATSEGNVTIRDRYFDLEKDGSGNIQKFIALKTQNPKLKLLAAIGGWNLKSEIFSNVIKICF